MLSSANRMGRLVTSGKMGDVNVRGIFYSGMSPGPGTVFRLLSKKQTLRVDMGCGGMSDFYS